MLPMSYWSNLGKDVGNVGFVEGSEAEAFLAEIFD